MKEILHILVHSLKHSAELIPFLFIAFLIIELIEHKFSKKTKQLITKSGKLGPMVGSCLGAIPQCGFSVIATNLYTTRIITLGTLIAIYLSTSDEMLPILISRNADISVIIMVVLIKVVIGMIAGFTIDFFYRNKTKKDFKICEHDHCDCEESIFKSSIIHTLKISLFILIINVLLNSIIDKESLTIFVSNNKILSPLLASIVGLIPNCASSIVITELYIENIIPFGSCIAGLLSSSGLGLLVLFKENKNLKENIIILLMLVLFSTIYGIIINTI